MLNWLRRRNAPPEPPTYTAITTTPARGVPSNLAEAEASEAFSQRCEAVKALLLADPARLSVDAPLFTQLAASGGLLTIPIPDGSGQCLPLFTSPLRAADYARVHFGSAYAVQYKSSTPLEIAELISALNDGGIKSLTIDRCPRCAVFMAAEIMPDNTARDLIVLWAIAKATNTARAELWLSYAEDAARAGDTQTACAIALEAVAHVTPDDRRAHVLLRDVAMATGDLTLLGEAKAVRQVLR